MQSSPDKRRSWPFQVLRRLFCVILLALAGEAGILPAAADPLRLVVLGDSLSAGYLLPQDAAFPTQLEAALKAKSLDIVVENAGVSGDTASGGLERLDWSVPDGTQAVILELGANDALRGVDPAVTRKALDTILTRLAERKIPVLFAGMLAPPNMGGEFADRFNAIYPELATKHGVALYPFFLDGVAGQRQLNLADGMHPTKEGVAVIVGRILPAVEALLRQAKGPA